MILRQAIYENRVFWRNPGALFFTFVVPLLLLGAVRARLIGASLLVQGSDALEPSSYLPGIVSLAVITCCYTNLAIGITCSRDSGMLKRVRATPLPASALISGRILQATVAAAFIVSIVIGLNVALSGENVALERIPLLLATVAAGAAAFAALGFAITAIVPNAEASAAVVNATALPQLLLGNVFVSAQMGPGWLNDAAAITPARHLTQAFRTSLGEVAGVSATDYAVLAAWGLAGTLVALRFFAWEPRR
jgi:ABC-2 type transport system permease protein